MLSRVILAVDLTPASEEVVRYARHLKAIGTQQVLLALCISTFDGSSLSYGYSDGQIDQILQDYRDILSQQGYEVKTEVVYGSAHKEINNLAFQQGYSAVVIGSHDHTLSQDILLGNVATEMIHFSQRPILVFRLAIEKSENQARARVADSERSLHQHVLYATDFSKNADEAFLYVEKLAEAGSARITLAHIQDKVKLSRITSEELEEFNQIDQSRLDVLKERLLTRYPGVVVDIRISFGKPGQEIVNLARELQPSLVVMGSKGKGYIEELFMGSVCHYVARMSHTHTLLVPLPRQTQTRS